MWVFFLYWGVILTVSWYTGGRLDQDADGVYHRGYPTSETGLGDVGPRWVSWRVCHDGDLVSYLLAYFILLPRGIVIGYNVIAMYRNMLGLFVAGTVAYMINWIMVTGVAESVASHRPGWPLSPLQECDHSPPVPNADMVASVAFVVQVAIMKRTCGVGLPHTFINSVLLMTLLYVVATVVNHYVYLWQAMASVGLGLWLAVVWSFVADVVMHDRVRDLSCTLTFRLMGFVDDTTQGGSSAMSDAEVRPGPASELRARFVCAYHVMVDRYAQAIMTKISRKNGMTRSCISK